MTARETPGLTTAVFPGANTTATPASFPGRNGMIARTGLIQGAAKPILCLEHPGRLESARPLPFPGAARMKRYINHLLQNPRGRFENLRPARQGVGPRTIATKASLRAEDGYDWLRQIKSTQKGCPNLL
jgi:hypothetical protein